MTGKSFEVPRIETESMPKKYAESAINTLIQKHSIKKIEDHNLQNIILISIERMFSDGASTEEIIMHIYNTIIPNYYQEEVRSILQCFDIRNNEHKVTDNIPKIEAKVDTMYRYTKEIDKKIKIFRKKVEIYDSIVGRFADEAGNYVENLVSGMIIREGGQKMSDIDTKYFDCLLGDIISIFIYYYNTLEESEVEWTTESMNILADDILVWAKFYITKMYEEHRSVIDISKPGGIQRLYTILDTVGGIIDASIPGEKSGGIVNEYNQDQFHRIEIGGDTSYWINPDKKIFLH